jgi:hypothetical protein
MKKADFMVALKRRNTTIIDDEAWDTQPWNDLEGLKKLTGSISFGCEFIDGKCQDTRKMEWVGNHPACCCKDCGRSAGYLDIILEKDIALYARKFTSKAGFWRKGKGCILPRKMRSIVCVTYACQELDGLYELKRIMGDREDRLVRDFEKYHGRELS